ncbi:DUF2332 family protein [Gemmobacter lutimaris]|uniref:DUF2332 family protein n=1 Tax=Gemmobacter lutimaris TaxID=2306023 RepID=A0A398BT68_9RHOB|nr:DUF2332 family protein [Gemmobacter lutimaris]RID92717.1 DUF2332 family protein [Gemmobacter lutimaris]
MADRLPAAFAEQAANCAALGSPFMERLMRHLAAHWPDDTALAQHFAAWPGEIGPRGASLPLRLASGLHALVLSGQNAELAAAYPGGSGGNLAAAVDRALHRHDAFLARWCDRAPQTNEIRRSAALIAVAHWLTARHGLPITLSELGASAGLNLMFDRYALEIGGHCFGPANAVLQLVPEWQGSLPPVAKPVITDRRGVDLAPLRAGRPEDELRLLSCLWPDQAERLARTRAALKVQSAMVDQADAVDWLEQRLATPRPGQLHLIYHTIAWQYFPAEAQARGSRLLEAAGTRATADAPVAWFGMEADDSAEGAGLRLRLWPDHLDMAIGRAGFHGQWIHWQG